MLKIKNPKRFKIFLMIAVLVLYFAISYGYQLCANINDASLDSEFVVESNRDDILIMSNRGIHNELFLSLLDESSRKWVQEYIQACAAEKLEVLQKQGAEKININTATEQQLQELPGIGSGRSQAIIAYREKVGQFISTEELKGVKGIGEKIYESIEDLICIE